MPTVQTGPVQEPEEIELKDLTNGKVVDGEWLGTGVFDVLMMAVSGNIDTQHKKGRLNGPLYADVYLGSIQSVISESVKFLLGKELAEQNAVVASKDAALKEIQAEKLEIEKRTDLMQIQLNHMVDLFKAKKFDGITEIISNQTEVEDLYNSAFSLALDDDDDDTTEPISTIIPGGDNFTGRDPNEA